MQGNESDQLAALLSASTPFIRIDNVREEAWCRVMQNPKDGRIGPWEFVADYSVLGQQTWDRLGEVLYFVTDREGRLRLVGQSMSKLNVRWKRAPMFDAASRRPLGKRALFHTSSWPAIEAGFKAGDKPPFTVSALFRDRLESFRRTARGSLLDAFMKPETHLQRLAYHVESWVCALRHPQPLWNKHKVQRT